MFIVLRYVYDNICAPSFDLLRKWCSSVVSVLVFLNIQICDVAGASILDVRTIGALNINEKRKFLVDHSDIVEADVSKLVLVSHGVNGSR